MQTTLLGTWKLLSWTISDSSGETISEPFGTSPEGLLVYTEAGWMSVAICRSNRSLFPARQSLRSLESGLLVQAYTSYFHYAGPFRVGETSVTHSVAMSHNPNFVGTQQVRQFVFSDKGLTLAGEEIFGKQLRKHQLRWQRLESDDNMLLT
ncbi:MAG: hypothetical protein ACI8QT_002042 [Halioglobus sp.]|jgi:hypothetical protein